MQTEYMSVVRELWAHVMVSSQQQTPCAGTALIYSTSAL